MKLYLQMLKEVIEKKSITLNLTMMKKITMLIINNNKKNNHNNKFYIVKLKKNKIII